MLLEAPTEQGRLNVAREVQKCTSASDTQQRLAELAEFYENHYLRIFKAAKGSTPATSRHASRPSFNMTAQEITLLLEEAPRDQRAAKRVCLARDSYRCIVSGKYDMNAYEEMEEANGDLPPPAPLAHTELAHIIPSSMNANISKDNLKRDHAGAAWAVLDRFGKVDAIQDQSNAEGIHRLENAMTLCLDVHREFDMLHIWLEAIPGQLNRYTLCATRAFKLSGLGLNNSIIELTTTDNTLPLPDPRLLRLHAACARVAHLSGAGERIDATLRDMEELDVLASDGGSVDVLMTALFRADGRQVAVH